MTDYQLLASRNLKHFSEDFVSKYDEKESIQALSLVMAKSLLQFDVNAPRKTLEESNSIIGDSDKYASGLTVENTLPPLPTFHQDFPNSVFKPGITLLDFACGTGLTTEKLVPYLDSKQTPSEIIGIDINPTILDFFNHRSEKNSSEGVRISSYVYDILDESKQEELEKFKGVADVIICTLSYHHLIYEEITNKLAEFLKSGGWLFVYDFYNEDVEKLSKEDSSVAHMGGLKIDNINQTFKSAGLSNVSSARENRLWTWTEKVFIESHFSDETVQQLNAGKIKHRDDVYMVSTSLILAIGQKT